MAVVVVSLDCSLVVVVVMTAPLEMVVVMMASLVTISVELISSSAADKAARKTTINFN